MSLSRNNETADRDFTSGAASGFVLGFAFCVMLVLLAAMFYSSRAAKQKRDTEQPLLESLEFQDSTFRGKSTTSLRVNDQ